MGITTSNHLLRRLKQILDIYKESMELRKQHNESRSEALPTNVILVGHSMGGFVARAVVVHPGLRKGAVETVLTLSSPHRSPPLAVQPSFGNFFSRVNNAWIRGYESAKESEAPLSKTVVVSITGGAHDYQVRSRMSSLDGIVPPTHGLTVATSGMVKIWMSMEHQSILWCNQMVVQVGHTLLQLIDRRTGQQYTSPHVRLAIFVSNFRSALPQTFNLLPHRNKLSPYTQPYRKVSEKAISAKDVGLDTNVVSKAQVQVSTKSGFQPMKSTQFACPQKIHWVGDMFDDIHIKQPIMNVLSMDGKRRWMDIEELGRKGRDKHAWFVLVTNLSPCVGMRVHLWPEKSRSGDMAASERVVEVTKKMVQLPSGPTPPQIEPGGPGEQASPSGVLQLSPSELSGFRYLTVSVAPTPTLVGSIPPTVTMAVAHFFDPDQGKTSLSTTWLLASLYKRQFLWLWEYHPMVWQVSVAVSLSTLPITLDVKIVSCGVKTEGLAKEHPEPEDILKLCKARCFPPVALVWDPPYGLDVYPNLTTQVIVVDSSPPTWGSTYGSEHSTILLLADPHCVYDIGVSVSLITSASRFLLVNGLQIVGLCIAVVLFALMRQARAWEVDNSVPSFLACMEANFMLPVPFLAVTLGPILVYFSIVDFGSERRPTLSSFLGVSLACYLFANGTLALLAYLCNAVLSLAHSAYTWYISRWPPRHDQWTKRVLKSCGTALLNIQVVRKLRTWPMTTLGIGISVLVLFGHPSLGLLVLLVVHTWRCFWSLVSLRQQLCPTLISKKEDSPLLPSNGNSLSDGFNAKPLLFSDGESHSEIFYHQQGLLILHLVVMIILVPSLVAWAQRLGLEWTTPALLDSTSSLAAILHGLYNINVDINISLVKVPRLYGPPAPDAGLSFIYLLAGSYCFWAGLALAPYRAFYALGLVGITIAGIRIRDSQARGRGRRHFHRH
uniref:GPI inositol-deacylase n=1 Tax=Physcomitrium patens TaxID=3218 RepID=A0A7I4AUK2_PHYPA